MLPLGSDAGGAKTAHLLRLPEVDLSSMGSPHCPRCRAPLTPARDATVAAFGCAECGGAWLQLQETNRLHKVMNDAAWQATDAIAKQATASPDLQGKLQCPKCGQTMKRRQHKASRISLDVCAEHGTWFDAGELREVARSEAIQRAYGRHRATKPVAAKGIEISEQVEDAAIDVVAGIGLGLFEAVIEGLFDA